MNKYRKKPIVIEAIHYDGSAASEDLIKDFSRGRVIRRAGTRILEIPTLEGVMEAMPNDWIIKGIKGELYPCKPDIFEATYEEAGDDSNKGEK